MDEPTGYAEPVETKFFELMMMFFRRQDEEFKPLGEVVGKLSNYEPSPVGVESPTGQEPSTEAVFELFDIVLGSTPGEMVTEDARGSAPAAGDDGMVEELADHALIALIERRSFYDHPERPRPALGLIGDLGPLGAVLPGIGFPACFTDRFDPIAKGRSELGRDGERDGLLEQIGDDVPAIEAGVHAQANPPTVG